MAYVFLTAQFKSDLDQLDTSIRQRVHRTVEQIERDPYYRGLETHPHRQVHNRKIMRSRINDNFRILWEWTQEGSLLLWRVGSHSMIDAINYIRTEPREVSLFARDQADHSAIELESLAFSRNLPQPFKHVPLNILRLFGVPEAALEPVRSLSDAEVIWDLPIPENVQATLYDILANPNWTLKDLLDTRQLLYRTTVDQLEGYCEGRIKQLMLNLSGEQDDYVHTKATGPVLIKGVAGSGKTTIGLYRAQDLAGKMAKMRAASYWKEDTSVLLLTYNRTLSQTLENMYLELFGEDLKYDITINTIDQWMLRQLHRNKVYLQSAKQPARLDFVGEAKQEVLTQYPGSSVASKMSNWDLLAEFDQVMRARALGSLKDYLAVERVGRGSGLSREYHRPIVWEIYERYQLMLDEAGLFDWEDLARLVQKHCPKLPQYDVVIVDEAQDLPPSDLYLITRLIPDYTGQRSLTLLADPAQSIYYRGIPWKEAGIDIRGGRTRILAKNFRNTQEILEAARPILEKCEDLKIAEEFVPPTSTHKRGPKPILARYSNQEEAQRFVLDKLIMLCRDEQDRYRPGDIAILAKEQKSLRNWQNWLRKENIPCQFFKDNFDVFDNYVKLITMHSTKGLEFPVVFLVDLEDNIIPKILWNSETKEEDEMQERKLFYVSMTRAAERLYLLHPKSNRCRFIYDLDISTVNQVEC